MATDNCTRCHRPLKNPASIKHGMGPVCYSKFSMVLEAAAHGGCRSHFEVVKEAPGFVWIRDLDDGAMSVTNDADAVVAALVAARGNVRIIYRDSMGHWDELCHDHGRFLTYARAADLAPFGNQNLGGV